MHWKLKMNMDQSGSTYSSTRENGVHCQQIAVHVIHLKNESLFLVLFSKLNGCSVHLDTTLVGLLYLCFELLDGPSYTILGS